MGRERRRQSSAHGWWSDEELGPAPAASMACLVALAAVVATCSAAAAPGKARSRGSPRPPSATQGKAGSDNEPIKPRRRAARQDGADQAEQPASRVDDAVHGHDLLACVEGPPSASLATPLFRNDQRVGSTVQRSYTYASLALRNELPARRQRLRRGRQPLGADARSSPRRPHVPTHNLRRNPRPSGRVGVTSSSITLAWQAAGDNLGVIALRDPQRRQSRRLDRDDAVRGRRV